MESTPSRSTADHLANERTFLAWIRTSVGIMAFGFVVVKFSLFVKQLGAMLEKPNLVPQRGYSSIVGIVLVAVGLLTVIWGYVRYKRTERQINEMNFKSSSFIISLLTAFILLISVVLIVYLIEST